MEKLYVGQKIYLKPIGNRALRYRHNNILDFIFARRESGYFDLRLLDGTKVHASAKCKDLKLLEFGKTLLVEKRDRPFLPA